MFVSKAKPEAIERATEQANELKSKIGGLEAQRDLFTKWSTPE
jgi:hypothetical protein